MTKVWSNVRHNKQFWRVLMSGGLVGVLVLSAFSIILWEESTGPGFGEVIGRIGLGMFVSSSLVYSLDLALAIIGWGWIMGVLSGNWQWMQHLRIYCITAITRRVPGMVWYLVGRVVLYERLQVARSTTAIASGVEFGAIVLGGLLVAIVTWPLALADQGVNPLWFVAGLLLGVFLLNPVMLRAALRRLTPQSAALDLRYRHLLGWIVLYAAVWIIGGGILFVLTTTIHTIPLSSLPAIIGIWATAGIVTTLLSFIPLGLGQELTLIALLGAYVDTSEAVVIALLMRAVLTINEALWALIAVLLGFTPLMQRGSTEHGDLSIPSNREGLPDAEKPEGVYDHTSILPQK